MYGKRIGRSEQTVQTLVKRLQREQCGQGLQYLPFFLLLLYLLHVLLHGNPRLLCFKFISSLF